jgi:ABC-2 type transport system ATP-binding protein
MTGRENLEMVGRLFGHRARRARAAATVVLEQLGLVESADRLVRTYSGGMRRKLDLGASLVGAPRLLLLDEPTTGLDPRSRIELWEAIEVLVAQGTDVLLTTQYLDEADQLADQIVIIDHGRAVASGTPSELKARAGRDVIEIHTRHASDVDHVAALVGAAQSAIDAGARRLAVPVVDGTDDLIGVVRALDQHRIEVEDVALRRPTLDEVFLTLTGQPMDGPSAVKEAS